MMTKKMLILTIVVLLVAMAVPAAFAAFNSEQEAKLKSIAEEMAALKKQLIDVYVEAGELTAEQGEQIKESLDYIVENNQNNGFFGSMGGMMGSFDGTGDVSNHCGGRSSEATDQGVQQQSFGPNSMSTMIRF